MTTPLMAPTEEPEHKPALAEPEASKGFSVWILRLISALVIPAVLFLFFVTVGFLQDPNISKFLQVTLAVIVGVGGVWLLYWAMDRTVSLLPERVAVSVRPFAFAGPAMVLLGFYLVYPTVNTFIISFQDRTGTEFVGLANYERVFTERIYLIAMRNSVLWAIVVPVICVVVGLAFATLADRLPRRSESFSKSLIFLPMAISFVGASVVWAFVYSFRAEGFGEQIGLLNAIRVSLGSNPVNWLAAAPWNNAFLMVILIWLQTGFAMVILSSAIKSVPEDIIEAARIDGATEWSVFRKIVVPSIASTIVVVWTTVLITTWKVFDIVFVMTRGRDDTSVVAERMVTEFFTNDNDGMGATLAVLLFIAVVPVLIVNVRRFREQEALR